ncbi:uncharacterized protein [Elaeis guineensis]|uniref:uncharacterized protein n=1 Tax=Elaeis guineensis var. tenera TaxID=51953 RepID=UPI003C6CE801
MPKDFWGEAVNCAVYLLNRCPTKILEGITPQEAWSGYKPNISHLKMFGCIAYAHIPDQRRNKLDDKSLSCIFIGYDPRSKAYKLYEPKEKKAIISRDVEFQEDGIWNWNTNMVMIQDEEQIKEQTREPTPPSSLISSDEEDSTTIKTRSIQDLYEVTTLLNLICLFANEEIIFFEDAIKDEKWRKAMNEEIKAIEKNETWKLTSLLKNFEPIGVK